MRHPAYLAIAVVYLFAAGCGDAEQGTPSGDVAPPASSAARGGLLYDKFWKVSSAPEPQETHPLWSERPDTASNRRTGAATWRCKECHGWDYRGKSGAYAKGSHRTGFDGILGTSLSKEEIRTSLAEKHGYRQAGLGEDQLESLALFVKQGLEDTTRWIDEKGAFRGDAARGKKLFQTGLGGNKSCRTCHGGNGLKPPKGAPADYADFVGTVANKNPSEFLHKVRFGHPGSKMPAAVNSKAPMQDILDLATFAQSLPTTK